MTPSYMDAMDTPPPPRLLPLPPSSPMEFDHAPMTPSYMDAMDTPPLLASPPSSSLFTSATPLCPNSPPVRCRSARCTTIWASATPPTRLATRRRRPLLPPLPSPPRLTRPPVVIRPWTAQASRSPAARALLHHGRAGEMSSDGLTSGRRSRGSGSHLPLAYSGAAAVPRSIASHRFNPIAASPPTRTRAPRRKPTRRAADDESDDEDDDFQPTTNSLTGGLDSRRETIRKQRTELEQRRRDAPRDGYTLPTSNQKSSKVSLLDRATNHVRNLEIAKGDLERRLKEGHDDSTRPDVRTAPTSQPAAHAPRMSCAAPSRHALTGTPTPATRARLPVCPNAAPASVHPSICAASDARLGTPNARARITWSGAGPVVRPVACCLLSLALCSLCPSTPYMRACLPAIFERYTVTLLAQNRNLNA
ncbi:hypothetical protein C8J57DRAFT_1558811 [Mycena rebaudengoi]|nr:hypothetical protein C8J57DRAFT_1558811 [Mycena rebaudengoi]